jgi:hypothetical protein
MTVLVAALLTSAIPVLRCASSLQALQAAMFQTEWLPSGEMQFLVLAVCGAMLNAVCLGPCLSVLARNTLAAGVFSLALPMLLWLGFGLLELWIGLLNGGRSFLWAGGLVTSWAIYALSLASTTMRAVLLALVLVLVLVWQLAVVSSALLITRSADGY